MIVTEWKEKRNALIRTLSKRIHLSKRPASSAGKEEATGSFKKRASDRKKPSFYLSKDKDIYLNKKLRLTVFNGVRKEALKWYQDPENMRMIVGQSIRYDYEQIKKMYDWQNDNGELYYIEYLKGNGYQTIGDVWLGKNDYAIVIDQQYQGRHIGRAVTKFFIYRSKTLGREIMTVSDIFNWNHASQRMFTQLKFFPFKENQNSWSYRRTLNSSKKKQ